MMCSFKVPFIVKKASALTEIKGFAYAIFTIGWIDCHS